MQIVLSVRAHGRQPAQLCVMLGLKAGSLADQEVPVAIDVAVLRFVGKDSP